MAGGIREHSHGKNDLEENAEINVTPFIDMMLVLLIIFMVAAPLATVDIHVDLPASTATPPLKSDKSPLYVTLKNDLTLALGDDPVARAALPAGLEKTTEGDRRACLFLRADETVSYEQLMALMNLPRGAGYTKIALFGLRTDAGDAAGTQPAREPPPSSVPSQSASPAS